VLRFHPETLAISLLLRLEDKDAIHNLYMELIGNPQLH
jgi:hypothetical protein